MTPVPAFAILEVAKPTRSETDDYAARTSNTFNIIFYG